MEGVLCREGDKDISVIRMIRSAHRGDKYINLFDRFLSVLVTQINRPWDQQ